MTMLIYRKCVLKFNVRSVIFTNFLTRLCWAAHSVSCKILLHNAIFSVYVIERFCIRSFVHSSVCSLVSSVFCIRSFVQSSVSFIRFIVRSFVRSSVCLFFSFIRFFVRLSLLRRFYKGSDKKYCQQRFCVFEERFADAPLVRFYTMLQKQLK